MKHAIAFAGLFCSRQRGESAQHFGRRKGHPHCAAGGLRDPASGRYHARHRRSKQRAGGGVRRELRRRRPRDPRSELRLIRVQPAICGHPPVERKAEGASLRQWRPARVRRRNGRQAGEFVDHIPGAEPGDDHSEHVRAAERARLRQLRIEGRRFCRLDLHRDQLPARRQGSRVQERPFERRRFSRCVGRPDAMVRRPDVEHGEDALPARASSASGAIAARHGVRRLGHVREMCGPRPRQHALGRRDRRRRSRGHRARRVRRGRGVRRVPDVHSRTETARNHSRGGQQERARQRRAAVSRASPHGAEGRGYFGLRRQLGQQGRQHSARPEDAEYRLRFARLSRRQSVRAQHRARVPARRRRARTCPRTRPSISRPWPA